MNSSKKGCKPGWIYDPFLRGCIQEKYAKGAHKIVRAALIKQFNLPKNITYKKLETKIYELEKSGKLNIEDFSKKAIKSN